MYGPLPVIFPNTFAFGGDQWDALPPDLRQILVEEGAKMELEFLRVAAQQNFPYNVQRITEESEVKHAVFSPELEQAIFLDASKEMVSDWLNQIHQTAGLPDWSEAAAIFNTRIGPYVGLRIDTLTPSEYPAIVTVPITEGPHAGKTRAEVLAE